MDALEETRWYELIKVCVKERVSGKVVIRWQDFRGDYYTAQRKTVFMALKANGWSPIDVQGMIGMSARQIRKIFNNHK